MTHCLLGLGSNLGTPKRQLFLALQSLKRLPKTKLLFAAPPYRNLAWGKKSVPDYLNTVVLMKTHLAPFVMLKHCQQIEKKQNRVRRVRNQARTIDIDMLSYGRLKLAHPKLRLPHPEMTKRDFVQVPLRHINLKMQCRLG